MIIVYINLQKVVYLCYFELCLEFGVLECRSLLYKYNDRKEILKFYMRVNRFIGVSWFK